MAEEKAQLDKSREEIISELTGEKPEDVAKREKTSRAERAKRKAARFAAAESGAAVAPKVEKKSEGGVAGEPGK